MPPIESNENLCYSLNMKCCLCNQEKSEGDFYPGDKYRCKDCKRETWRIWKHLHPELRKQQQKHYRENPIHKKHLTQYYQEWYRRNGRKRNPNYADVAFLWQQQNPEKVKAKNIVHKAIRQGIIRKPIQCSNCSIETKLIAHHNDYSKPLEVIWLCVSCHKRLHSKLSLDKLKENVL